MKTLLKNANILTFLGNTALKGKDMNSPTFIEKGGILIDGEKIVEVFDKAETDKYLKKTEAVNVIDCGGNLVTSGLVDCHTHFVFGGSREKEFNMRLNGASYMDIMASGGGILNTVESTRKATLNELILSGKERLKRYLQFGVTYIEGKSGYGLDLDTELKQLKVMSELEKIQPIEIVQTYLGAHAIPKGSNAEEYINYMNNVVLTEVKKTDAEFVDCFCEKGVFSVEQCKTVLQKAKQLGFGTKVHAEEMVRLGGSALAVEMGSISCEHLLHVNDEDISNLANSNTIDVLLPATAFSLGEEYAPARKLIDSGAAVSIATDFNPGSCNTQSIPLIIALSCMYMKMTIHEVLCALTINGGAAIGKADKIGSIEKGKQADIVIYDVENAEFLSYNFAVNHAKTVIKKGEIVLNN